MRGRGQRVRQESFRSARLRRDVESGRLAGRGVLRHQPVGRYQPGALQPQSRREPVLERSGAVAAESECGLPGLRRFPRVGEHGVGANVQHAVRRFAHPQLQARSFCGYADTADECRESLRRSGDASRRGPGVAGVLVPDAGVGERRSAVSVRRAGRLAVRCGDVHRTAIAAGSLHRRLRRTGRVSKPRQPYAQHKRELPGKSSHHGQPRSDKHLLELFRRPADRLYV